MKTAHYIEIDKNIRKLAAKREIEIMAGFKFELNKLDGQKIMIEGYLNGMEKEILGRKKDAKNML